MEANAHRIKEVREAEQARRLGSIDATLEQLRSELRTVNGQLVGLTAMVCLLGLGLYLLGKQAAK